MIYIKMIIITVVTLFMTACGSEDSLYLTDAPLGVDKKIDRAYIQQKSNVELYRDIKIESKSSKQSLLDAHNRARVDVGVLSEYRWSDTISKDAQKYADEMALSGVWAHDSKNHTGYKNGPYGENLFISNFKPTYSFATNAWIDEKAFYHYGKIGDDKTCDVGKICGHYTQVVWERSSKVGCAVSRYVTGKHKGWYIIVCKYQEPGNYLDETPY